jgi:TorA maturation chaperone TorD
LIDRVAKLDGDDGDLGSAVKVLARIARATKARSAEREFNRLFIGVARGELLPYASYYMTGFLNEKPLAMLRNDMARYSIERAPNVFEPEDNDA